MQSLTFLFDAITTSHIKIDRYCYFGGISVGYRGMFVDKVQVNIKAGDGGNGVVSFRHEIYVDKGGPDGGDGGDGGDVILISDSNESTLAAFRYHKRLDATPGKSGGKRRMHGRSGDDLLVHVPLGTVVSDEDGKILIDFTEDQQKAIIAKGGKGGFGNAHFVSSIRQAPRLAEKGEPGEELTVTLELKMIADVGLVGLPNAGKSTLLSVISNARPEIADYPFTTLTPNLGVVDIDDKSSLLVADIPGLIEGAAEGKGLGDEFLRHVERTEVLIHLIDAYQEDLTAAYRTIQKELAAYSKELAKKAQVAALTKIEGLDEEMIASMLAELKMIVPKGTPLYAISSKSKTGLKELLFAVNKKVLAARKRKANKRTADSTALPVLKLTNIDSWRVTKTDDGFMVTGRKIERFALRTDFANRHAVERLRDIMRKMGIMHELSRQNVEPDQNIHIGAGTFKY